LRLSSALCIRCGFLAALLLGGRHLAVHLPELRSHVSWLFALQPASHPCQLDCRGPCTAGARFLWFYPKESFKTLAWLLCIRRLPLSTARAWLGRGGGGFRTTNCCAASFSVDWQRGTGSARACGSFGVLWYVFCMHGMWSRNVQVCAIRRGIVQICAVRVNSTHPQKTQ
jgi:hypothetical protein